MTLIPRDGLINNAFSESSVRKSLAWSIWNRFVSILFASIFLICGFIPVRDHPAIAATIDEDSAHQQIWHSLEQGQFAAAEARLRECAKVESDSWCLDVLSFLLWFQGRYAEAESTLRLMLWTSNDARFQFRMGLVLIGQGKAPDAIPYLEKAKKLNVPEVWLTLGAAYMTLDRKSDAISAYDEAWRRFPKTSEGCEARSWVDLLKLEPELKGSDPDYFKFVTSMSTVKWIQKKMPLKVYLQSEETAKKVPGYRSEFRSLILRAFADWIQATNGNASVRFVDTAKGADMQVKWLDEPGGAKSEDWIEAGHATPSFEDDQGLTNADIVLRTRYASLPATTEAMYGICLHEVGHALGLVGHSPYPGDIMYFLMTNNGQLSERDKTTLCRLYRSDVRVMSAREIMERMQVFATEQDRLLVQSMFDISDKKFNSAIETLKRAIAINSKTATAAKCWEFLGACYLSIHRTKEAVACFKTALTHPKLARKDRRACMQNYAEAVSLLKKATRRPQKRGGR